MNLIAKAQVLQHRRMEALRKYAEDVADIDRRRHELDLASARAWVKVTNAGWVKSDLTSLGLQAPTPRTRRREAATQDRTNPEPAADPNGSSGDSDG